MCSKTLLAFNFLINCFCFPFFFFVPDTGCSLHSIKAKKLSTNPYGCSSKKSKNVWRIRFRYVIWMLSLFMEDSFAAKLAQQVSLLNVFMGKHSSNRPFPSASIHMKMSSAFLFSCKSNSF